MMVRFAILGAVMALTAAFVARSTSLELIPSRPELRRFPTVIDGWSGVDATPLSDRVLEVLGADDYVSRIYTRRAGADLGLFVGYYGSQRQGDSIHSPLNCLPGAGWQPMSRGYDSVTVAAASGQTRRIRINRVLIQNGLDRQVVLYWYQSHGRVVASEYWSKLFMVFDAIRLNRTDAALVRVALPVSGEDGAAEEAAGKTASDFVRSVYPLLERFIPS
jgi:EpsI family protein